MKNRIIADSSCDMPEIKNAEFISVPLTVATDERSFVDDNELDVTQMMQYLAGYQGRSYTACPNVDTWLRAYRSADGIFVVTLSSNISGTYAAAASAAEIYKEENPDARIHIFDTLSAGPEVRMLVQKIAQLLEEGKTFDEICALGEAYMQQTRILFALQSFHNFAQNGRVNKTVAKIGSLLGICIMATASDHGTIEILDKCRGEKGTLKKFLERLHIAGYHGGKVCLAHCRNLPFARCIAAAIQEIYPQANIEIYETRGLCSFYAEEKGLLLGFEK